VVSFAVKLIRVNTIYVQEVFMKVLNFVLPAYVAFSGPFAATTEALQPFTELAQAEETTSPNSLDIQDRLRDRERDRAHDDVRARLGDQSREPHRDQGFTGPNTDYEPDVPDARAGSRENR
jgi:hypothetical protein